MIELEFKSTKETGTEKLCNACGAMVKIWVVWENAPICKECCPNYNISQKKTIIPNESTMIKKLIKGKNATL